MKVRELFEGVINNKMPTLDIINFLEESGGKELEGIKKLLNHLLSDFSLYLQDYVDKILEKNKSDKTLIESYELEENINIRNFYLIQSFYQDAGLRESQAISILRFATILQDNIEQVEYLESDKVTMEDSIGDSYKEGITNSFFAEVHNGGMSDLEIYARVQELTDNFNSTKINLLCKDFDFYFFWEKERWLGDFSDEKVSSKIEEYKKAGKIIPMMGERDQRDQGGMVVSDFFKPDREKMGLKSLTEERKKKIDEVAIEMKESLSKVINIRKLMDPLGLEFFSLYKFRNLLVELKSKYTNAELRDEYKRPSLTNENNKTQPIHWLKGDKALRLFLDSLKSAGLIEDINTDEIIQEHFRQFDKKPKPIMWSKSNRLMIYLFNKLSAYGVIDTMDRQYKLITEHFVDKNGHPFKRNSLKQDSYNLKYNADPIGSKMVDAIINKL